MLRAHVTELSYNDEELTRLTFPRETLRVTRGIGSGLSRREEHAPHVVWAVGDRGPNLGLQLAIERYGLENLSVHADKPGAKLMPCPGIGPAIVELHVSRHHVTAQRTILLSDVAGRPLSGLPPAGTPARNVEPALGVDGSVHPSDPAGADTEGLAAAPDGSFWIGDEYGPSLLHIGPGGSVRARWVPAGTEAVFAGANYPVAGALPALAARRRLNRGIEGMSLSTDGRRLHLAFQSPLAHPDDSVGRRARHVRLWTLETSSGALLSEHLYPLDRPGSFRRDCDRGNVDRGDVKLGDMAALAADSLLVLERVSATTKLYLVTLDPERSLGAHWRDPETRPTIEQLSADDALALPVIDKWLVFSTDDHPEIVADLEGLALLDERTILLVNDNDFGIEGVATRFWRVELAEPLNGSDASLHQ
ncbi:MAG: esterase-like activity of phytase family protein [Sphingomonadaceae bacterium]|nr:esterase-like activity of phytase family protein [Sphingomonadaceae bacterium]